MKKTRSAYEDDKFLINQNDTVKSLMRKFKLKIWATRINVQNDLKYSVALNIEILATNLVVFTEKKEGEEDKKSPKKSAISQ